jgi:hypothetical protein
MQNRGSKNVNYLGKTKSNPTKMKISIAQVGHNV